MLDLLVYGAPPQASPALLWLRDRAKTCLSLQLRSLRAGSARTLCPSPSEAAAMLESLPPIEGAPLQASHLIAWHQSLELALAEAAMKAKKSPEHYLASLDGWQQLGMLCLHLAENAGANCEAAPFAFLASFVHKIGADDKPRHMPLGLAAKHYAEDNLALLSLLRPLSEAAADRPFLQELIRSGDIYKPCAWSPRQCYDFLNCLSELEIAGIETRVVNLWKSQPKRVELEVKLEIKEEDGSTSAKPPQGLQLNSLLNFLPRAALGAHHLSDEELAELMEGDDGLIRFRGEWIRLDKEKLTSLLNSWRSASRMAAGGIPLLTGLRYLLGKRSTALAELPEPEDGMRLSMGEQLRSALEQMQVGELEPSLSPTLKATLRPYQLEGARFLLNLTEAGFGACLADDMGLGKSIQIIAWLSHLQRMGQLENGAALIIAPASLLSNWQEEISRFAPELRQRILHPRHLSTEESRQLAYDPSWLLRDCHVAIMSYGVAMRSPLLAKQSLPALILDEAQAIKNLDSSRSRAIQKLQSPRRVAVSGTPIENKLAELHSLLSFLNPGLLGNSKQFAAMVKEMGCDYSPLKKLIRPFILRRLKSDPEIVPELPEKTECALYCSLSPEQARLYTHEVERMQALIQEPDIETRVKLMLPLLSAFKQICNHPAQYLGEPDFAPERSGKMMALAQLLEPLAMQHEPVLIFSQYRSILDALMEQVSGIYGREGLMLHGGTPIAQRQQLVRQFQDPSGPPFMLLSLKAAGTGLTLTRARHVIHFDRWWNPAVENQASDRAHRIGQKQRVFIHPLICRGTLEENIERMLKRKKALADDILSGGLEKMLQQLNGEELLELVRLRA